MLTHEKYLIGMRRMNVNMSPPSLEIAKDTRQKNALMAAFLCTLILPYEIGSAFNNVVTTGQVRRAP